VFAQTTHVVAAPHGYVCVGISATRLYIPSFIEIRSGVSKPQPPGGQNLTFPITLAIRFYNSLYYRTSRDIYRSVGELCAHLFIILSLLKILLFFFYFAVSSAYKNNVTLYILLFNSRHGSSVYTLEYSCADGVPTIIIVTSFPVLVMCVLYYNY